MAGLPRWEMALFKEPAREDLPVAVGASYALGRRPFSSGRLGQFHVLRARRCLLLLQRLSGSHGEAESLDLQGLRCQSGPAALPGAPPGRFQSAAVHRGVEGGPQPARRPIQPRRRRAALRPARRF